ncbi:transcription factor TGA2.2-like [Rutidosis leptorrhynchoides]|uniref:transcription factor TGA2.2-like n=1 Tax=Rutidosis leptorrhynchoides TaxID=125765 RepID=UPI003A9A3CF4
MVIVQSTTLEQQMNITTDIENLKDNLANSFVGKTFVDKGDFSAMNNFSNEMSENIRKLTVLNSFCDQADDLRISTIKKMQNILIIRQRALALIALHNYQKRLVSFNHQWEAVPI